MKDKLFAILLLFIAFNLLSKGAPQIIKVFPENGSSVYNIKEIYAISNIPLNPSDINLFTVSLNDGQSELQGEVKYIEKENKIVFIPTFELTPNTTYRVTISKYIRSKENIPLKGNYIWFFSIGNPDFKNFIKTKIITKTITNNKTEKNIEQNKKEPFKIIDILPKNTKRITVNTPIQITFNKPILEKSINKYTIILKNMNEIVEGFLELSNQNKTVTFLPKKTLNYNTIYTLNISNLITSKDGDFLDESTIISFKTKSPELKSPLIIERSYPNLGQTSVDPNIKITIFFSEPLKKESINRLSVLVKANKKIEWCNLFLSDDKKCLIIQPANTLPLNSKIEVKLLQSIKSINDNTLDKEYYLYFFTAKSIKLIEFKPPENKVEKTRPHYQLVDLENEKKQIYPDRKIIPEDAYDIPRLLESYPAPNSKNIPVNINFYFRFNKPLKFETVNAFNFLVKQNDEPIAGKLDYNKNEWLVKFKPHEPLKYNTEYQIIITTNVKDKIGNKLDRIYQFKFKTAPPPDKTPPQLIEIYPTNGDVKIKKNVVITMKFSEKLDPKTLNSFNLLLNNGEKNILGNISYNPNKFEVYFKPIYFLKEGIWYTFTIKNNIKDLAGNNLINPKKIRFLVGPPPDKTPPTIVNISPKDKAILHHRLPLISITFSEDISYSLITPFNFYITDKNKNPIPGRIEYTKIAKKLIYKLLKPLKTGDYYLIFNANIYDSSKNKKTYNIKRQFSIRKKKDILTIFNIHPLNGGILRANENIFIDFSKDVNPISINPFTLKLVDEDRKIIAGKIEYNPSLKKAYFWPKTKLNSGKKYYLIISKDIQDIKGKKLDREYRIEFKVHN